jgi:archaellum component FlaC
MNDHIPDATKMIDTPRMHSALMDAPEAGFANIWKVGCDIERELNTAQERIKRLEEMYEGKIGENEQFLGSNLQGLLTRELNAANERIKRLDETLEAVTDKIDNAWGIYMKFKEEKP